VSKPALSDAIQDYLKEIYKLLAAGERATTTAIARQMGVAPSSATSMLKKLAVLDLAEHAPYRGVTLTDAGTRIALEVIRHHRLVELYLAEALGYHWDEVHDEAERLEHHVSEELEARMDSFLGHPTVDPHGDPIPSREGTIADIPAVRLVDLDAGEEAVIRRVSDRDAEQLRYLGELGLRPGAAVTVLEKLPFDGPIRIRVDANEHVIGQPIAAAVNVERAAT
jgi:DtxR family Mn-dependent transcriptional regulator